MVTYAYLKFSPMKGGETSIVEKLKESDKNVRNGDFWIQEPLTVRMESIRSSVKKLTGRRLQDKTVAVRMGSVYVKDTTTKEDVMRLVNKLKEWKVDVFQFAIVPTKEPGTNKVILLADWIDSDTGTSLKLTKEVLSDIRNLTADVLNLEHGQTYKEILKRKQILQREIQNLEIGKATKERIRGVFGMSEKDTRIRQLEEQLNDKNNELKIAQENNKNLVNIINELNDRITNLMALRKSDGVVIKDLKRQIEWMKKRLP